MQREQVLQNVTQVLLSCAKMTPGPFVIVTPSYSTSQLQERIFARAYGRNCFLRNMWCSMAVANVNLGRMSQNRYRTAGSVNLQ